MITFDPEKITYFAKTDARGQEVSFGIRARDRQRHMYVVGKTGMGKSTLLENMAAQDIQNGEGMAFIDPHGSAAETLLEYVPEHRVKDVVYFAPFDLDNPVAFNVMEDVGSDKRHLVVSGLMSTFKKIWVDAWSARMEYILTNALLALIEYPDTTLLSVNRLFSDKGYRKKVVEYIKDPAVKSFWVDEYAGYTERFTAEALPAIQNKIGQFTGNPLIRNIIGQPHSSFDIREMMDNKKILIMNLSKGLIGETNANLLGSMLTTRIYLAAMSRANLPVAEMKKMPNFYFYVDEFQSFANATFANILSEARKYHLNLVIAHQYIEQMEEDVRSAVFGNVGTTIAFRVGPFDAEVLETVFAPRFEAADLVNLGFAQIYLTLMIDGIGSQPFSAITLPPVALPSVSCREMVVNASRKHYASKRVDVEQIVADLHTPEPKENNRKPFEKKSNNYSQPRKNYKGQSDNVKSNNSIPRNTQTQTVSTVSKPRVELKSSPNSSPDRSNPAEVKKTSQDLRQVLAKMSENSEVKNSLSANSVTQGKRSESASVTSEKNSQKPEGIVIKNTKSSFKTMSNKPAPQVVGSPVIKVATTTDPKNSLADALQKIKKSVKPAGASEKKEPSEENTFSVFHPKVIVEQQGQQKSISAEKQAQRQNNQSSQIRKVVVERRQSPQLEVKQSSQKPAYKNINTSVQKLEKKRPATVIDSEKIKRMLRQNGNERSPFN